jgi:hypothetical protein
MQRLFKPFYMIYGIIHVVVGVTLVFTPEFYSFVLNPPPLRGSGVLIAFLSTFAGLALFGIAFVESHRTRSLILRLTIAGSGLNAIAHLTNSIRGDAPAYTGPVAAVILALVCILLISIDRSLDSRPAHGIGQANP